MGDGYLDVYGQIFCDKNCATVWIFTKIDDLRGDIIAMRADLVEAELEIHHLLAIYLDEVR